MVCISYIHIQLERQRKRDRDGEKQKQTKGKDLRHFHTLGPFDLSSQEPGRLQSIGWQGVSSVQFSRSVMSNSLRPHDSQHARPPCPSPPPELTQTHVHQVGVAISSSVIPFSSHLQSFSASGSFQMSQLFISGGQSIGVSASTSVLPMNTQD